MRRIVNRSVLGSLALLLGLYFVLFNRFGPEKWHGLVLKLRRPGQMTIVEALAMEMETMKPPEGVLPVVTEIVKPMPFEVAVTYTGTVAPLNEELVVARVTGRLTWMPYYAGDRVRKGQLIAKLDNAGGEYAAREMEAFYGVLAAAYERQMAEAEREGAQAQNRQAQAMLKAAQAMRNEAEQMVAEKQAMLNEAQAMLTQAQAGVQEAERSLQFAQAQQREAERMVAAAESEWQTAKEMSAEADAELERARQEVEAAQQELAMAKADWAYWEAEIERAKTLFAQKAISKDELQREQAQYETAKAKVKEAEAKIRQAQAMVRAAEAKRRQVQGMIRQKEAELAAAKERVAQMRAMVEMAQAKLAQMKAMADAAQAKLQQARAALEAAKARLQQAQAEVARAQAMLKESGAAVKRSERQLLKAEAMRAQRQATLTTARIIRGYTEIRSLTDGYVLDRFVSPGTLVTLGTPILRIGQLDIVRVQAFVSEKDLKSIRLGTPVLVRSVKSGRTWHAKVTAIFPAADPTTRTGLVEALVPNPNLDLLPGESVIVRLVKFRMSNALTVPNEAITRFNDQPAVWVAEAMAGRSKTEYTCPMHPEVRSEKPGKCTKCDMELVPTHRHMSPAQTDYTCPMHPEVHSPKPGRCPKCGMELVPKKRQGGGTKMARLKVVQLGPMDGERTVVLAGLTEGDEVIVRGWQSISREGAPLRAVSESEWRLGKLPFTVPTPTTTGGASPHGH